MALGNREIGDELHFTHLDDGSRDGTSDGLFEGSRLGLKGRVINHSNCKNIINMGRRD